MSTELKATIYEPSKDPRTVSRDIEPEFVPLIDRGVYFNEDGTLCDDYQELQEDLAADETIYFNTDSVPSSSTSNWVPSTSTSNPIEYTDVVYPLQQKQKKIEKRLFKLERFKHKPCMRNTLRRLRKRLKYVKESEATLLADPASCIDPIPNANKKQGSNQRRNKKKGAQKWAANNSGPSQTPNPSKFPAFIRNPWMRKNTPKNAPSTSNPSANLDFIPIAKSNNQPRFRNNSHVPPLTNNSRYFNLNNS